MQPTVLASYGYVVAKALSEGGSKWTVRKMYIEFENVASTSDPVSVPTIDAMNPDHGTVYYEGLNVSSSRDYIRADLITTPMITTATGYSGYFSDTGGNNLRVVAQTNATEGVHGKAFSQTAKSKICGIAIVAAPVESDPTQDIVIARGYLDEGSQILKLDNAQIGITCDIPFTI